MSSPASSTSTVKSVRFAPVNDTIAYSPPPPLVHGDSDVDSPPLRTPPQLPHSLPPSSSSPINCEFRRGSRSPPAEVLSIFTLLGPNARSLKYNVAIDPAVSSSTSRSLTQEMLDAAATKPPVEELYIVSKYLPWKIPIQPSQNGNGYVSVSDVLRGLHFALRQRVTEEEFLDSTSATDGSRLRVDQAFHERAEALRRVDRAKAREETRRRIDYLGDNLLFAGLSPTWRNNEWRLSVRPWIAT